MLEELVPRALCDTTQLVIGQFATAPLIIKAALVECDQSKDIRGREPFPRKAKWKHEKRYHRLRNQVHALEAQAKRMRFRKEIDDSHLRALISSPAPKRGRAIWQRGSVFPL
jgi:hypothetical protein